MRYIATERKGKAVVLAQGEVVTVQIADCGDVNGENTRNAQMIADALTVLQCDDLLGIEHGMGAMFPQQVILRVKGLPVVFEGGTLEQALHGAARKIRGENL